jgi:hypothetical protein
MNMMNIFKGFIFVFIAFCICACVDPPDENSDNIGSIENYRLINPNNLLNNCEGYLMLNFSTSKYILLYDFTCISLKDTVKFSLSESGIFSDSNTLIPYGNPDDDQGYYFSGKFSFQPEQQLNWGCTYLLNRSEGFDFTYTDPAPLLITNIPVYNQKMIYHITDSVQTGLVKPWIEVIPLETGRCDTMRLFWR